MTIDNTFADNVSVADTVNLEDEFTDVPVTSSDVGASLPSPDEVRTTVNMSHGSGRSGNGRFLKIVIASLVLAAILVGVIVGVSAGGSSNSAFSNLKQGDAASDAPRKSTVDEIITYMANSGVSDLTALTTVGSPQSRAAAWMAEDDDANLPVPTADGEVAYKYTTRYAMVVLYYSTGGDRTWASQLNFLTSADVCNWYGLFNTLNPYRKGVVCDGDTGLIVGLGVSK
jgi:hypothetical protein